ncbi:XIAP-associated factor 1 [Neoarius graeffei]|uniref:XIAP-associated factor 1 n=1 Tax=Neoarius graeffei TaxID=443677 RepID=UPI00298D4DDC|nr:XIAP-associated factor 1 [Neoarius graeffei]
MDPAEELAVCNHCNKEVVKMNLPMHEAHCQRFLCICPDCDEQVPKDHLEEHQQEQHAPVKCKKCNMKMEKRNLPDHEENECPERDQSCEYCELTLPLSSLKEHIVACGSRTERCEDCNQYVILKDKLQHAQICTSEDFSFKTKSINGDVKPVPVNTLQDNELADLVAYDSRDKRVLWDVDAEPDDTTLSLSDLQKKKKWTEKMGWKDEDQISTCPYCHLALPLNILQWHENKCRICEGLKRMSKAADASVKK